MSKDYFMPSGVITLEPEEIIIEYIYIFFFSFVTIMAPLAYTTLIAGNET